MLRITPSRRPADAKRYYTAPDYYLEGQELPGLWRGKGAAMLGLAGNVEQKEWEALCDNLHPETGSALTPRQKENRRVGYDFNFHVPKSVSLLYGLTGDERVLAAFQGSVNATMRDIEAEMKTRVRTGDRDEDRVTGNMVWGEFIHTTARPVDGVPDPHLHAHCFVFNTTWDTEEHRWKAGQFGDLKRDAPFFEAVFLSRLARSLEEIGLPVERTRKGWELAGLERGTLAKFSRRTALIEQRAREEGISDPVAKSELGAKTREAKQKHLTLAELRSEWRGRLTPDESGALAVVAGRVGSEPIREERDAAREGVEYAVLHHFERSSVVAERRLLAEAMRHSVGKASPEAVAAALAQRPLIAGVRDGERVVTTPEVLAEERKMVAFARDGRGTLRRLGPADRAILDDELSAEQRRLVGQVLGSRDRVTLIRGAAGTGKTRAMRETIGAIEGTGVEVFVFAPSAEASRGVLRNVEGFSNAETVARLLVDEQAQQRMHGQVLWIDEAGLLSGKDMGRLFDLASRLDARVVLQGDRGQHGSVERGAALRLLEEEAGVKPLELREIRRQEGEYREAVRALSEGRSKDGFERLDKLGWIREVDDADRYKLLADDYVASLKAGKTTLVVAPTHREGEWVASEIRARLRDAGRLKGDDRQVAVLQNLNLTEAERSDGRNYEPGDVLVFHQNAVGHRKGERVVVGDMPLPLDQAARFQAYRPSLLPVAAGELVRMTRGGTTLDGKHSLNNGAAYSVKGFDRSGNLVLANGWAVGKEFGHLAHAYASTSHASQGKTVQRVLIAQSSVSHPASSAQQWYVSVSRGRERATIYTDDREALLAAVSRSDERLTATELAAGKGRGVEPVPSDHRLRSAQTIEAEREDLSHER